MWRPFLPLARQAVFEPREAASAVLSIGVPSAALWPAFALFVILSSILVSVSELLSPSPNGILFTPVPFAIVSGFAGAASVFAIWRVGRAMDGTGSLNETLLLMVFLQGILLIGQLAEFVLFLVAPPLSWLVSMALLVLAFWLNLNFIAVLHGFSSLMRAFGCLLLASAAVALALIFGSALFGVSIVGAPPSV